MYKSGGRAGQLVLTIVCHRLSVFVKGLLLLGRVFKNLWATQVPPGEHFGTKLMLFCCILQFFTNHAPSKLDGKYNFLGQLLLSCLLHQHNN